MTDFFERVAALRREGRSFAVATVVARRAPVSAHLAIARSSLPTAGWKGLSAAHARARSSAGRRAESLTLRLGRLVSIRPDAIAVPESSPEHVVVPMTCASEGAIDVYIEPFVRARTLVVVGATPVAGAVARLARALEYDVVRVVDAREQADLEPEAAASASRVALTRSRLLQDRADCSQSSRSQGHYDEEALGAILRARPPTSDWWRRASVGRRFEACFRRAARAAPRQSGFPQAWIWGLARPPRWRCRSWRRSSRCIPAATPGEAGAAAAR